MKLKPETPELLISLESIIRKNRGAGRVRNKISFFAEQGKIIWEPAARLENEEQPLGLIFLLNDENSEPYFYPIGYLRNRFFLSSYENPEAWIEEAIQLSNGKKPFIQTFLDRTTYK